jgi:putative membrane protein
MPAQLDPLSDIDPWAFVPHPEVWLLVGFLTGAYVYMVRVIGPTAVGPGQPVVTRRNVISFTAAIVILWVSSDWPVHDISEDYLYFVHMIQHMALAFWVPPLALMATPEWLMRTLIGRGRAYRAARWLTLPVVAALLYNGGTLLTHIPGLVNASIGDGFWNGALHYALHVIVVTASLLMWMPVLGPIPEFRLGYLGRCGYLFAQSIVPTIPAAFLTFADSAVYDGYEQPIRLWGLSIIDDQQLAGGIMKLMGGMFLWALVIVYFIRYARQFRTSHDYRRGRRPHDSEIIGNSETTLTTADVEAAFARTAPARDED